MFIYAENDRQAYARQRELLTHKPLKFVKPH